MKDKGYRIVIYSLLILTVSCLEPYTPPAIKETLDILVVDGLINAADSTATVRLSKATPLSVNTSAVPERNATVLIEDENGSTYTLAEESEGTYKLSHMALTSSLKYRLSILTENEAKYLSDYIELERSPPIDSVTWKVNNEQNGINIFVNTHGTEGINSRYYQWSFVETWEYTANYPVFGKIQNDTIVPVDVSPFRCWVTKPSTEIFIASSKQLNEDIIRNYHLMSIPNGSQKISRRYSILVQQRSLSKEAYDFWTDLKKTTENLGSLFDPLPAQVLGNIHREDEAGEPVLGYFDGGFLAEKRLFINANELPRDFTYKAPLCPFDSIKVSEISSYNNTLLVSSYGQPVTIGYLTSSAAGCVDCRGRGGNLIMPDFW